MRIGLSFVIALIAISLVGHALQAQPLPPKEVGGSAAFRAALQKKLADGKTEQASAFFMESLKAAKTALEKRALREEFLRSMARAGKPIEAYKAFPGGKESFRTLAEQLVANGHTRLLSELVAEYATFFDDDPYIGLYRGQIAFEAGKYADADASWTDAFKSIDDEFVLEQFQRRRVTARYKTDKILDGLSITPAREAFTILAEQCLEERKHAELTKLLAAYGKLEKSSSLLVVNYHLRMHLDADFATLQKIAAAAPDQFGALIPAWSDRQVFTFLATQGRAIEAYKAAPDPKVAFQTLAAQLLQHGDFVELRRLIDMHRKANRDDGEVDSVEGQMLLEMNQFEMAAACFKKGLAKNPPRPNFITHGESTYITARHAAGKGLEVYAELGKREVDFSTLARLYAADRDAAGLEALLKARPAAGVFWDMQTWKFEAKLKMISGKPEEALAMYVAHRKQAAAKKAPKGFGGFGRDDEFVDRLGAKNEETDFLRDMMLVGHGLAMYRVAASPEDAFRTLANHYRRERDADSLAKLVAEHRGKFPSDPDLAGNVAYLELMRGAYERAEEIFRAELARRDEKQPDTVIGKVRLPALPKNKHALREGLKRAIIGQAKTVEFYRASGSDPRTFDILAALCSEQNARSELEALLAVHRKNYPEHPSLGRFDAEAAFLKGDYENAWQVFKALPREDDGPRTTWAFRPAPDDYSERDKALVCLVRLKRFDDAVRLGDDWQANSPSRNPTVQVLPYAAAGNVKQTLALMEMHGKRLDQLAAFYRNGDLGPLLRGDKMTQVRERFPEPTKK